MRASVVAAALCVIAASAIGVTAIQWTNAFTDGGNLFYPGVGVTFRFWAAADVRFDTTGVGSNTNLFVEIGPNTSPILTPGTVTNYFDGWLLPPPAKGNSIQIYAASNPNITVCTINAKAYTPYTFQTVVISGSLARNINCYVNQDDPRWYQASFWTGLSSGAWHHESLWAFPGAGDRMVEVFVPLQSPNNLRPYINGQQVYVNLTVSDSIDGDYQQPVYYHGAQIANTPYFNLAPFFYQITIVNNQGLLSQGSTVQLTGAALDPTSTFSCVWNNTENSVVIASPPTAPSSTTTFTCQFPDALAAVSNFNDDIILINVTTVTTTDPENGGWIPFASNSGNQPNFRYWIPTNPLPPDNSSVGLTGGQIFGIILAVFVGAALLGYAGFRLYKSHVQGGTTSTSTFGYDQPADSSSVDNKPKQIQYNPQAVSYHSNDV